MTYEKRNVPCCRRKMPPWDGDCVTRDDRETNMSYSLTTLSPLDGRYRAEVATLEAYFSEAALFRYRARVEIEYLIFLTRSRDVRFVPKLTVQAVTELRGLYRGFSMEDAEAIAEWDRQV